MQTSPLQNMDHPCDQVPPSPVGQSKTPQVSLDPFSPLFHPLRYAVGSPLKAAGSRYSVARRQRDRRHPGKRGNTPSVKTREHWLFASAFSWHQSIAMPTGGWLTVSSWELPFSLFTTGDSAVEQPKFAPPYKVASVLKLSRTAHDGHSSKREKCQLVLGRMTDPLSLCSRPTDRDSRVSPINKQPVQRDATHLIASLVDHGLLLWGTK
ncbi:hypothetical protein BDP55DRAFT_268435 [Colletotrichum godetiae]|uniref:Uncharacterized protein n=1 Tax=Colletotrichum godetiae TaxID=1209918 RepID=A0AAJ0AXE2_9PEZI|nr:uncharacterized protein BDP55DRAFT_268435 [Colletotrichum godetiae]KAK1691583.1 hypothetical protein BDP55DRAFT_268435 [Colletotrichum godetiae]